MQMKNESRLARGAHQKNFVRLFGNLCGRNNRWTVWSDFIAMSAISISNAVDKSHFEKREKDWHTMVDKYTSAEMEIFSQMLAEVVQGMDENPDQDFLGELYMSLELGNDHAGQFFTPYCVCQCMAAMQGDATDQIERNGWISVNDPACGAGALMMAFANDCRRKHIQYQMSVLFVAQDIDYIVGCMCYLQLSLMGCAGYVKIGDSLLHPCTSYDARGLFPRDDGDVWYTPMFFHSVWHWRRIFTQMDMQLQTDAPTEEVPPALQTIPIKAVEQTKAKNKPRPKAAAPNRNRG